jgi:nucleoid-associated protein YgaU
VSVETEDGGRLFVSGQAAPGATVRLYLNETFIAPGGAGGDGKVSFAIGRGMKPGDYRVRLDDVDPVSGGVKSRAEVAFNVPPPAVVAQAVPAQSASVPTETAVMTPVTPPAAGPSQSQGEAQQAAPSAASGARNGTQVAAASPESHAFAPGTVVIPDVNTAIVSRGDNLWRISQRIYGHGTRYTVIYGANQKQIRNPNLIYPGQVFVLPSADALKATP